MAFGQTASDFGEVAEIVNLFVHNSNNKKIQMNFNEKPPFLGEKNEQAGLLKKPKTEDGKSAGVQENFEINQTPEVESGEIEAERNKLISNLQKLEENTTRVEEIDSSRQELPLQILVAKMKNAGDKLFSAFKYLTEDEKGRQLLREVVLPSLIVGIEASGIDVSRLKSGSAGEDGFLPNEAKEYLKNAGDLKTQAAIILGNRNEIKSFSLKNLVGQFQGDSGLDWEGGRHRVASKGTSLLVGAGVNLLGYSLGKVVQKKFNKK